MQTSFGENIYIILFIDDFTRLTEVYILKEKVQVFEIFKEFLTLVEKQSGCILKTLRFDNSNKYT